MTPRMIQEASVARLKELLAAYHHSTDEAEREDLFQQMQAQLDAMAEVLKGVTA